MTRYEKAEVEFNREQGFILFIGDTNVKVTMSTLAASLLLSTLAEQGVKDTYMEAESPEFLGWTIESIAEDMEND